MDLHSAMGNQMTEMLDTTVRGKLKKILVIDDAYAPAEADDIEGEPTSRFINALQDDKKKITQLKKEFKLEALDPSIPKDVEIITQNSKSIARLWELKNRKAWQWLSDTLFREYEQEANDKLSDLEGFDELCTRYQWKVKKHHQFDPNSFDITWPQVIFFDFFLKRETSSEQALKRAVELGQLVIHARQTGKLIYYPLIVLMSSRPGAGDNRQEFKLSTALRADFFCFIEKSALNNVAGKRLGELLLNYQQKQKLAHLLDEYWLAALRAATELRSNLALIEPTELALLHEAELGVEEAILPDYMSWLVSESLSAKLLEDKKVQELGNTLPPLVGRSAFPGSVPPGSLLADMFVRSVMRLEVNDDAKATIAYPIALGDLFTKINSLGEPQEMFLVVDQSCDLARPKNKKTVLCLQCFPEYIDDIALAFYRNPTYSNGVKVTGDLIPIKVQNETKYYLARWDMINPITLSLIELKDRKNSFRRIARYKPIRALARQEQLTQQVGRIGEPVSPPTAAAYRAKLVLHGKNDFKREFDATKEPWASVIVVQGRHLEPIIQNEQSSPDLKTSSKSSSSSNKKAGASASTTLSFSSDFSEWLISKLENANFAGDNVVPSKRDILVKKIQDGAVQRLLLKASNSKSTSADASEALICKANSQPLSISVSFSKTVPDSIKEDHVVLLLTPHRDTVGD